MRSGCINVLTQVATANAALQSWSLALLEEHLDRCVTEAMVEGGEQAQARVVPVRGRGPVVGEVVALAGMTTPGLSNGPRPLTRSSTGSAATATGSQDRDTGALDAEGHSRPLRSLHARRRSAQAHRHGLVAGRLPPVESP
ncbi:MULTISPECIES: metal-sensitive transcriptional regulator [Streptomyces]|uniref:metal-sensitive transcriptional regulator n=1 Tax=Streptomyces TaxID=1883 RepID=UPI00287FCB41|nr:metal-sensitive transcriptional regulator [Streptomyces sp. CGMCC 4.1456]WNF66537.1 metal-sensitive transcriptional regulator [Streptomyces sp. CGMCC 4.1456]